MLTRSQIFAQKVYERVKELKEELEKDKNKEQNKEKYGTIVQKMPVLIRTAGLAQAISFLEAKSNDSDGKMNKRLLQDLSAVLEFSKEKDFLNKCRTAELTEYLRLTQDVLTALLWFKRFAVSVLEVEEGGPTN